MEPELKQAQVDSTPTFKVISKRIAKNIGRAIATYGMIEPEDRVGVALSGGKDSWTLLHELIAFSKRSPIKFTVVPITVDTGYEGFDRNVSKMTEYIQANLPVEHLVIREHFPEIIGANLTKGTSNCSFCARLRRGTLYTHCQKHGITKLALGHHREDVNESLLMSLFYNGRLWTQGPVLKNSEKGITIIRPLIFCAEEDLRAYASHVGCPVVTCNCPHEGNTEHKRYVTKQLILRLRTEIPDIQRSLLSAAEELFPLMHHGQPELGRQELVPDEKT